MSEEEIKAVEETEEEVSVDELLDEGELELAYKHDILKKEEADEESEEKEEEESTEEVVEEKKEEEVKEEVEAEHSEDLDKEFDEMADSPEKEFEGLQKRNKTEKAFYWKWKNDKKKRQEAQAEAEILSLKYKELEARLDAISNKSSQDPLDDLLKENEKDVPVTKAEYEADKKAQQEAVEHKRFIDAKIKEQEAEARNKYEDYSRITDLAGQVIDSDPTGTYRNLFIDAVNDPKKNAAEVAYKLGKMHPYANQPKEEPKKELVSKNVDKIEKNLKKKSTSAALGGAGEMGPQKKAYSEMTWKDASGMSTEEWLAVPRNIRNQLLKASCAN